MNPGCQNGSSALRQERLRYLKLFVNIEGDVELNQMTLSPSRISESDVFNSSYTVNGID